jgi:hypothetical protein
MPDRTKLKVGDRIRLLCVPAADLKQRERELRECAGYAGWTADTIERILRQDPFVRIDRIDEYGQPWFNYTLVDRDGVAEEHTLVVIDDDSWTRA